MCGEKVLRIVSYTNQDFLTSLPNQQRALQMSEAGTT